MDADSLTAWVTQTLGRRALACEPIAAGMGARRFFRIRFASDEPRTLVARCEPDSKLLAAGSGRAESLAPRASSAREALPPAPTWLPEPALEPLRGFLEAAGLPVPKSFGHFPELGIELLEDVGSESLLGVVSEPEREALYREACALVPRLQSLAADPAVIPAFGRRYDAALIETKLWKWLHWAIPGLLGREATAAEYDDQDALFVALTAELEAAPRRLAHRDFKAENLHLRPPSTPDGDGARRSLVLIDVQGAFVAPPEYDLVCLLYDLQCDLPEALASRLFAETVPSLPDHPSSQTARLRFDAIAVTRLCKDVAHVVHAGRVRGDFRRWHEIPRGLALLERAARRLEGRFPGIPTLISVIHALTTGYAPADSAARGRGA